MDWISCDNYMPNESGKFLVTDGKDVEVMYYFGDYKGLHDWSSYYGNTINVSHWQELPELPLPPAK